MLSFLACCFGSPAASASTSNPPRFPYTLSSWIAVDDRVRGGSSISHLDACKEGGVRFWGHLDTKTLGGAGFASQVYDFPEPLSLPSKEYSGLRVRVRPLPQPTKTDDSRAPTVFTLILKTDSPVQRPDGRQEARISYEAKIDLACSSNEAPPSTRPPSPTPSSASTLIHSNSFLTRTFDLPFSSFIAFYRGRPTEDQPPLDPSSITSLSLMCRSYFETQDGDFELFVHDITEIHA